jgi:hypothetical protein
MLEIWAYRGGLPTKEHRQMDKLEHIKNLSKQECSLAEEHRQIDKSGQKKILSKGHSLSKKCRWLDKLEHGKILSKQGALTFWEAQTDRQIRTCQEPK